VDPLCFAKVASALPIGHSVPVRLSCPDPGHVRSGRANLGRERRRPKGMHDWRASTVLALVVVAACSEGDRDDADVATSTRNPKGPIPVEVTLYHCGIEPIWFEGRSWEVPEETGPFDEMSAPEEFVGRGTVERNSRGESLRYVDESGIVLFFEPDDGVDLPCA
jgi:hypothetical protein